MNKMLRKVSAVCPKKPSCYSEVLGSISVNLEAAGSGLVSARPNSSSAASGGLPRVEELQDVGYKKIQDYTKYISRKSALREPSITRAMTALTYKAKLSGKKLISLAEGMPNESIFPFEEISIKIKDGTNIHLQGKELDNALQYIPSQGLPQLVNSIKAFQLRVHNPPDWANRDVIVTSGSQDGIYKCTEMLVDRGDPVLVQAPLYSGTHIVMKPYQPRILEVKQDAKGLIPAHLKEVLEKWRDVSHVRPKVLFVNPTGNNPTGTVIPNSRRQEIYDLACEYDLIILEDDAYHFIYFTEEPPKSFISYDTEGRVLRFDSLSKVLSSGLRLGWVTGPKELINVIELHMQASYLHSSTLTQAIAYKLFEQWGPSGLDEHLSSVRDFYREKRRCLLSCMERHLTGLAEWDVPEAGMFVWLRVNGVPDVYDMIFRKAFDKGVSFIPGHAFASSVSAPCPYIRVTFSRASEEDMDEACRKLAELIREEQQVIANFTPIQ